jgi:hypothetical protein
VFSPDGVLLAMAGVKVIRLWEVTTGKERVSIPVPGGSGHVAFSPDVKSVVTGGDDKVIRLWELASGKPHCEARGMSSRSFPLPSQQTGRRSVRAGGTGRFGCGMLKLTATAVLAFNLMLAADEQADKKTTAKKELKRSQG